VHDLAPVEALGNVVQVPKFEACEASSGLSFLQHLSDVVFDPFEDLRQLLLVHPVPDLALDEVAAVEDADDELSNGSFGRVGTARAVCDDPDVAEDHVFTVDPFGAMAIEQQKADVVGEVLVADRDSHCGKDDVVGADDEINIIGGRE
jgi:hypothetical protein